jgi:hypothetical protein
LSTLEGRRPDPYPRDENPQNLLSGVKPACKVHPTTLIRRNHLGDKALPWRSHRLQEAAFQLLGKAVVPRHPIQSTLLLVTRG